MNDALETRINSLELALRLQEHRLEQLEAEKIAVRLTALEVTMENISDDVQKIQEASDKLARCVEAHGAQIKTFMWSVGILLTLATIAAPFWIR